MNPKMNRSFQCGWLIVLALFSCSRSSDSDIIKQVKREGSQSETIEKTNHIGPKEPELGDNFSDIHGMDLSGNSISLTSLQGKTILLDFWASWCGPCRKENPSLLKLYRQYNTYGFEIFSYSVDKNITAWKKAVLEDSLIWANVIEQAKGGYSPSEAIYNVHYLPTTYLIDRNGIIVAKNLRGTEFEEKLKEVLGIDDNER
jgi:thiol-disulfide isomerase/thioredoxin